MRINVSTVTPRKSLGVITFENGEVSFSTDAARDLFQWMKDRGKPRPVLSDKKTIDVLKSWSNGYVLTQLEK